MTLFLMFIGVIFYSSILTELLDLIQQGMDIQAYIQEKNDQLKILVKECKIPNHINRKMMRNISLRPKKPKRVKIPEFPGVNDDDKIDLLFENFKTKMTGYRLFNTGDRDLIINFCTSQEKYFFPRGTMVYKRDDISDKFYLIKSGIAMFMLKEYPTLPFLEIQDKGFFGETEIWYSQRRKYNVRAQTDLECYVIREEIFRHIFMGEDLELKERFEIQIEKKVIRYNKHYQSMLKCIKRAEKEIEAERKIELRNEGMRKVYGKFLSVKHRMASKVRVGGLSEKIKQEAIAQKNLPSDNKINKFIELEKRKAANKKIFDGNGGENDNEVSTTVFKALLRHKDDLENYFLENKGIGSETDIKQKKNS